MIKSLSALSHLTVSGMGIVFKNRFNIFLYIGSIGIC